MKAALDFLECTIPNRASFLKNRTVVQSVISLTCSLIATGRHKALEATVASFIKDFLSELSKQVELGQAATDHDYLRFQRSINANVKAGPRSRQEILLRKAFTHTPSLAAAFDPSMLIKSGLHGRIAELGESIADHVTRINEEHSAKHGNDLFKMTNKTNGTMKACGKPIKDLGEYKQLITNLYFLFKEGVGDRLDGSVPDSFIEINTLRTECQHDTDHGDKSKVKAKKKKAGTAFQKYSGSGSPDSLEPGCFALVQANILTAIERDLANLTITK